MSQPNETTSMNAILICPEFRLAAGVFHRMKPLALMPVLGRSLLDLTLAELSRSGVKQVLILAADRPEIIREAVGHGAAWGLKVEVQATTNELTVEEAEARYADQFTSRPQVRILDHLPDMLDSELWRTHFDNFQSLLGALERENLAASLTMREVSSTVWISTKARISSTASLCGPLWIGPHATVKSGAHIGPGSIIESGAFIDNGARVENTWVGPHTYVGVEMNLLQSVAWGNGLLNWQNGSFLELQDAFLQQDISLRAGLGSRASLWERVTALILLIVGAPLCLIAVLKSLWVKAPIFSERRVLLPPLGSVNAFSRTFSLLQLNGTESLLQRWPELGRVLRGEMALVGNRPLSPEAATALRGEVGQLWIADPAGVFSLADAQGADPEQMPEALAHAACFSVQRSFTQRLSILVRCLTHLIIPQNNSCAFNPQPTAL